MLMFDKDDVQVINTARSNCPWFAKQDRERRNQENEVFWTTEQKKKARAIFRSFEEVYGIGNTVMNVNRKFFTIKVFKTRLAKIELLPGLKRSMEELKDVVRKVNDRNEVLYNIYVE